MPSSHIQSRRSHLCNIQHLFLKSFSKHSKTRQSVLWTEGELMEGDLKRFSLLASLWETSATAIADDTRWWASGSFWGLYQHSFMNTVFPLFTTPSCAEGGGEREGRQRRVKATHKFDLSCFYLERFRKKNLQQQCIWDQVAAPV